MIMVKKRDGRKELFIPEKIVVSALKSGSTPDYARTIAQDIEKSARDGVTTQEHKDTGSLHAQVKKSQMGTELDRL